MNVFLTNKEKTYLAKGIYNPSTNALIVIAGSTISNDISSSPTFHGVKTIKRLRNENTVNGVTIKDIPFTSPSTAACFVTGKSKNGMISWKTEEGVSLKQFFQTEP